MNPFTEPIYNIYESPQWSSCNRGLTSRIISKNDPPPEIFYTNKIASKDLFFVEKYISDELAKLLKNIYLVKKCDSYANIMMLKPNIEIPAECNKTFKNFSHEKMNIVRNDILQKKSLYYSQLPFGENVFNDILYTDSYKNENANSNDKKEMCQRFADLSQLLTDFKRYLDLFNNTNTKNKFKDEYDTIMAKYNATLIVRNELNNKLYMLYDESYMGNSKLYLDSTVYTSVLWTILATTVLFFIFKKM